MTQKQIKELFNISPTTFQEWKNPNHARYKLYLLINSWSYEKSQKEMSKVLQNKEQKA
ncbi:MAG: hypothetical protein U9N59_05415 [Campylobacterota bacterium]|nr:hypothetical protein [Campylobacterota bacterium]